MIKWFPMPSQGRRSTRPTIPTGRAAVTTVLVLSTLALAPPRVTGVHSARRAPPDNAAGPYAVAGLIHMARSDKAGFRADDRGIAPDYNRRYALARHSKVLIPAFARKFSLPCSACHTVWPELNSFGQRFRDNGYQLGNDRDAPIWQNPSYFPLAVRTTPQWHLERTTRQPVDAVRGDPTSGKVERTITQQGFDLSGVDFLMLGTLHKNISFGFIAAAEDGSLGVEAAYVRFDDLFNSHWANFKVGKFELDNLVSEKRGVFLSGNGGFYQNYHFAPVGDATTFGLGDNQIGAEFSGHSANSYTRYGAGIFGTTDGESGVAGGRAYDASLTFSQAFDAGSLGIQRIGAYAYVGQRPTVFETADGEPIAGTGTANKPFQRYGVAGDFFFGDLELMPLYMRAQDDAYLGTATPGDEPLPAGARAPKWNGGLLEVHYYLDQQNVLTQRSEFIRMSQQAFPSTPGNLGNIDAYSFGYRWYPMMTSRAGLAIHSEFSMAKTIGNVPLSGLGVGLPPLSQATAVWSRSLLFAVDFVF